MTSLMPNNHVTNSLDLLLKMQENLNLLHKIQVVEKHGYVTSKTGSRQISQDKLITVEFLSLISENTMSTYIFVTH